jgi:hypothetical protein
MKSIKSITSIGLIGALLQPLAYSAVRGDAAAYIGGTVTSIKKGEQGTLNLDSTKDLVFRYGNNGVYSLPYSSIREMEFGQKVGRRVGSTIALGVTTLGVMAIPMLLSKKKKHYLTVAFVGEKGGNEVAVWELATGVVRTTIPVLEARTGKKVDLQEHAETSHAAAAAVPATPPPAPPAVPVAQPKQAVGAQSADVDGTNPEPVAYVAETLTTYHREGCPYLPYGAKQVSLSQAKQGRTACKICKPAE